MRLSPLVVFHVCAGILGLLSGAVAVSFRKGSRGHRMYGNVLFLSMLGMSEAGAFMAFTKFQFMNVQEIVNIFAGTLTFYLVATAWSAARRKDGETGIFDWGAVLAALAVRVGMLTYGLEAAHSQTGLKFGYPAALYFVWASVALLSAAGDACMLARGGVFILVDELLTPRQIFVWNRFQIRFSPHSVYHRKILSSCVKIT
jgi:uncharacterized membrane protein